MRNLTQALTLTSMATAVRSAFKIASVNPVLWWDAESHRAGLAGGVPTLFQDSGGTSAVSAVEQPVGLVRSMANAGPRRNLLTYSEQFDNAAWLSGSGCTIQPNSAPAPNGTIEACTLSFSSDELSRFQQVVNGGAGQYANTVWLRAPTGTVAVRVGESSSLIDVVLSNVWQRFTVVLNNLLSYPVFTIRNSSDGGVKQIEIWRPQLERGPVATSYQRVTSGLEYLDARQATSTARPILTARKNLLTYSEQFDQVGRIPARAGVSVNNSVAPNGTQTADLLFTLAGQSDGALYRQNSPMWVGGSTYSYSVYAQAAGKTSIRLSYVDTAAGYAGGYAEFSLTGLGGVTSFGGASGVIVPYANGWYRCCIQFTVTSAPTYNYISIDLSGAGNGVSGVNLFGEQLEYGSPTSYQRITTASDYDITAAPLMLQFDGVDDFISSASFAAGLLPASADAYIVFWPDADEQEAILVEDPSSSGVRYFGSRHPSQAIAQSADGPTTASAQYTINGLPISGTTNPTRAQLFWATRTGAPVLLQVAGLNLSAWTQVGIGRYVNTSSGFCYKGRHGALLITPAQSDATRAKIRKALAKAYQIQGVV